MSDPESIAAEVNLRGWNVITPTRPLLDLRLRELWQYRDLIFLFFRRDFIASYKQTVLGPFWFFAQPVLTAVVFWVVFGRIGKIVTKGVPQFLFFMGGIILWTFFSTCVLRTATSISGNSALFGKVYFPRLTVPLSIVLTNITIFAVQFVCFVLMFGASWWMGIPVHANWRMLVLPALLLDLTLLALGVGCIVAALTTRFRDLALGVTFGVQLWMYASCIVFPLGAIGPEKQWIFVLNPIVPIVEAFRFAFLSSGIVEAWHLVYSSAFAVVSFVIGIIMFRRAEQTAMDTV